MRSCGRDGLGGLGMSRGWRNSEFLDSALRRAVIWKKEKGKTQDSDTRVYAKQHLRTWISQQQHGRYKLHADRELWRYKVDGNSQKYEESRQENAAPRERENNERQSLFSSSANSVAEGAKQELVSFSLFFEDVVNMFIPLKIITHLY